jgi:hypothetical protein
MLLHAINNGSVKRRGWRCIITSKLKLQVTDWVELLNEQKLEKQESGRIS